MSALYDNQCVTKTAARSHGEQLESHGLPPANWPGPCAPAPRAGRPPREGLDGGWKGALPGGDHPLRPCCVPSWVAEHPDFNLRFLPSPVVENGTDQQLDPLYIHITL